MSPPQVIVVSIIHGGMSFSGDEVGVSAMDRHRINDGGLLDHGRALVAGLNVAPATADGEGNCGSRTKTRHEQRMKKKGTQKPEGLGGTMNKRERERTKQRNF